MDSRIYYYIDRPDVLRILIAAGTELENGNAQSTFMQASSYGHDGSVMILLDYITDINMQDNHGNTAVLVAAYGNNPSTVKFLIECGADVSISNRHGKTALGYAYKHGYREVARLLEAAENGF